MIHNILFFFISLKNSYFFNIDIKKPIEDGVAERAGATCDKKNFVFKHEYNIFLFKLHDNNEKLINTFKNWNPFKGLYQFYQVDCSGVLMNCIKKRDVKIFL